MDYVQNPYFTDENVEKEKGIIAQEIKMYEDYPEWQVYLNAIEPKCVAHIIYFFAVLFLGIIITVKPFSSFSI